MANTNNVVQMYEVTGIKPKNKKLYSELLEIAKTDWKKFIKKADALSDDVVSEIGDWLNEDHQNMDSSDVYEARRDLVELMDSPSGFIGERGQFHAHGACGWTVDFDYWSKDKQSKFKRMNLKVQPVETHSEMSVLWEMHQMLKSPEDFCEWYLDWYKEYKVPDKVRSYFYWNKVIREGGDDADIVS